MTSSPLNLFTRPFQGLLRNLCPRSLKIPPLVFGKMPSGGQGDDGQLFLSPEGLWLCLLEYSAAWGQHFEVLALGSTGTKIPIAHIYLLRTSLAQNGLRIPGNPGGQWHRYANSPYTLSKYCSLAIYFFPSASLPSSIPLSSCKLFLTKTERTLNEIS